ncbi:MAG: XTP/dITP diphosphatase [Candidatus Latescibacteria bacterium]|jgi:XTP/dITP diphosphohydrolase|nr:XTP/dITP diphosphatase [Candidatus Latescibacterota bacterium]
MGTGSDTSTGPTLVVATGNLGKLKEIREILGGAANLLTLQDFPDLPEIVEDGDTFKANAIKKARTVASLTGHPALGDDSGLEVDALDGAPGVYSARYAGESATDGANNDKLLSRLRDVPETERTARFRCVVAVALPDGTAQVAEGSCEGRILEAPRGNGGFGYDPLFLVPKLARSFAELPPTEKNRISHRGRALKNARPIIERALAHS